MADATGIVYNIDVLGLVRRINRPIIEVLKSQSSGVSQTIVFDIARLNSYIDAIDNYRAFVVGQPLLDCPETGPKAEPLPVDPVTPEIENESLNDAIQIFEIARDELKNSQSARLPSNLIPFDDIRLKAFLGRLRSLVSNYMAKSDPLDLPESSPMFAVTGSGLTGV